jgi:hypothetical protein
MTGSLKKIAAGCASVMLLVGATSLSANASYLGYGNGDPGNWDLWTEQNGGINPDSAPQPRVKAHMRTAHHTRLQQHRHDYRAPQFPADKS